MYYKKAPVPQILIQAQELQKNKDFINSIKLYTKFFKENPINYMRFKALFEIADNWYYQEQYKQAYEAYTEFLCYCKEQKNITEQEKSWVDAYCELAKKRIQTIKAHNSLFNKSINKIP